jgi:hypothetical protein
MGRSHDASKRMAIPVADVGPTVTATLRPSARQQYEVAVIEGRPPKTVEVPADDRSRRRYCLAGWVQSGRSADYTYLCRVWLSRRGSDPLSGADENVSAAINQIAQTALRARRLVSHPTVALAPGLRPRPVAGVAQPQFDGRELCA